ncbi:MAG: hypothetical protein K8R88_04540 [Armatimonadetes bacterium]|nr:hypothetical protein [Armatimonadota bacterium]
MLTHLCLAFLARPAMTMATASASIVPPEPLAPGGYTERGGKLFEPGGDDLKCRVIVLRSDEAVAIVSLEMLTVPESLKEEVQKKLPAKVNLFLSATHTHCAPDSQMLNRRMTLAIPGIASFRRKWLDWFSTRIADTISLALRAKRTSVDKLGVAEFRLLANRGRRKLATPSTLFTTILADGKPLLMSYAAHPVNYDSTELKLRSDWPGALMNATGGIVLDGAIGDVSPKFGGGANPQDRVDWFVKRVLSQHPKPRPETTEPFQYRTEPVQFDAPTPHPNFARDYKIPAAFADSMVKTFAPPKSEITAIRIGKTLILGIPGEPTAEMGQQIIAHARARGFRSPLVISHVNGWAGYMLLPDDYDRGGYEANLSFFGRDGGTRVVEAANRATDALSPVQ